MNRLLEGWAKAKEAEATAANNDTNFMMTERAALEKGRK